MKSGVLILALVFSIAGFDAKAQIPALEFVKQFGSTGQDDLVGMTTDASGNIYVTGRYNGTVDFDPGAGVANLTSSGQADMYVLKLDANANPVWARSMGSATQSDAGDGVAVDASGNVYAIISFTGTFDADPGPSVFNLSSSAGTDDIGVIKLDASGNFVWAVRAGGTGSDLPADIAIDSSGDIYVTGGFQSTNVDFDPGAGTTTLSAAAIYDIFIWKLSSSGALIWVRQASGSGSEFANQLEIDHDGNVVAAGDFQVTVDFDPGAGVFNMAPGGGADNAFVWKLDANGNFVWARQMGGTSDDVAYALAVDTDNNIYVSGVFQGTADFDPGAGTVNLVSAGDRDVFVTKLASDGSHLMSKSFGGTGGDYSQWIGLDASRNIYLSGYFFGITDLDPGTGRYAFASAGSSDVFFSKLDATGNLLFAYPAGGTGADVNRKSLVNTAGDIFVSATFNSVVDFDPQSGSTNLTSAGSTDIALQKIIQQAVPAPSITSFTPVTAMAGSSVIITGANFSSIAANNTVQFNGTTAAITTVTLNSITVTVPFGAITGAISVTVNGLTATSASSFTVIPSPVITFTVQPSDIAVCPYSDLNLSATATGTTGLTYQWQRFDPNTSTFVDLTEGSGYFNVTSTSLFLNLGTGATIGDYRVRVNGNLAAETYSDTATITLLPQPPAPTATPVTIDATCGPVAVTLSATSSTAGEFRWYINQNLNFYSAAETQGSYTTPPLIGPSRYHVAFYDGVCESEKTVVSVNAEYEGPGAIDTSFQPAPNCLGCTSLVESVIRQPDGKFVLSNFETGGKDYNLVRLLADGSVDPSFSPWEQTVVTGSADPIGLLPDGKILLGGGFTAIDGNTARRIARFNEDGSHDLTFNTGTGFNGVVREILVQPDGKILVAGAFTTYNGATVANLVRLNNDGTLDASFTPGTGANASLNFIRLQPDNKIFIGGSFSSYNGQPVERLARLNTDGTLDGSFVPASGLFPLAMFVQSDGKLLVGGEFTTVGGLTRNNIVRLNADGSVDTSFDPGGGPNELVYSIYQEPSGKILIGGWFEFVGSTPRNFIARLYPDGKLDPFFDAGVGPFTLIADFIPFDATQIFAVGYISHWNDLEQNAIALVNNECIRTPVTEDVSTCTGTATIAACGGSDGQYRWYTSASGGTPIAGETSSTLQLGNLTAGTTYYVSLADAVCESPRVPVNVIVNSSSVTAPSAVGASACSGNSIVLNASGSVDGNYRWYVSPSGGGPIAGAVNAQFTTPVLTTTTSYYVSIFDGSCESARTPVVATVFPVPANPGVQNITACSNVPVTLFATGFNDGQYRWYNAAQELIANQTSASINVGPLTSNTVYYVSSVVNNCESSRVPVNVSLDDCNENTAPQISTGTLTTPIGGLISLELATIISDPDGNLDLDAVSVISQPSSGALATISNGFLTIDYAGRMFSGTDQFTLRACDATGSCTDAEISIQVVGDVIVYNAVSPNGDALNDILFLQYIDVLEDTRDNTVVIYNRWGDEVFRVNDYDNVNRVFKGVNKNGNMLPSGTYFYTIHFSSNRPEKSGYLSLQY